MSVAYTPRPVSGRSALFCLFLSSLYSTSAFAADTPAGHVPSSSFLSMLQVMFGLGLVLAAIAGTAWLLKRFAPGQVAASGALRVVGGVAVGPKERVVLVDVGDSRLVLGVTAAQISLLHRLPRPENEEEAELAPAFASGPFYSRLREMLNKRAGA
jgi:flagellar protein FliO/FliZ